MEESNGLRITDEIVSLRSQARATFVYVCSIAVIVFLCLMFDMQYLCSFFSCLLGLMTGKLLGLKRLEDALIHRDLLRHSVNVLIDHQNKMLGDVEKNGAVTKERKN